MPTPADEWEAIVRETIAAERWVIDGNYGGTIALRLEAADTAIFLDVRRADVPAARPTSARSATAAARAPTWGRAAAEKLPDLGFLRWIWSYPSRRRPGVLAQLAEFERSGGRARRAARPAPRRGRSSTTCARRSIRRG